MPVKATTVPEEFHLSSKNRGPEKEHEKEEHYEFHAQPLNKRILEGPVVRINFFIKARYENILTLIKLALKFDVIQYHIITIKRLVLDSFYVLIILITVIGL